MAAPSVADLPGRTTTAAIRSVRTGHADVDDDPSRQLSRRQWIELAWGSFTAASLVALASTGRMMFPNVLDEPSQQFKAGFPNEYGMGVDDRWKDKFGVWLVRTPEDLVQDVSGFYALIAVCTHLGCTPNYLPAEQKFKCPCHGRGFPPDGYQLRRARVPPAGAGRDLAGRTDGL
jgi:cytochrome b6-f complex iron-sulfur subunit